jgi:hypothetical protein
MINHPRMATAIRGYKNQKRIMKKEYIKPEMVVEEMLLEGMFMLAMSGTDLGGEGKPFANERDNGRGSWGNLWD